ncbi:hypothetical protein CRM22_003142 [Opisthorchis felineus]|uniref:Uncharacterized protein n=1 Tax=Opisthorchis felineus TaxID=147828 RepID=A0A4S2M2P5_OPIFE|nr:hypothetical protein CRM22_003142 [Opisthorchis felineus]
MSTERACKQVVQKRKENSALKEVKTEVISTVHLKSFLVSLPMNMLELLSVVSKLKTKSDYIYHMYPATYFYITISTGELLTGYLTVPFSSAIDGEVRQSSKVISILTTWSSETWIPGHMHTAT